MLHGIGSGYVEAESFGSVESSFKKKLGSGVIPMRFQAILSDSVSASDSGAGIVAPSTIPCNVGFSF
ncbi:hypothetical protein YC2023_069774 [Brassica napus]